MEIIYRAFDGTDFVDKNDCSDYEKRIMDSHKSAIDSARILKNFCKERVNMDGSCTGCPFADQESCSIIGAPHIWPITEGGVNEYE